MSLAARAVITGMGVHVPVAISVEALKAAVLAGR